MVKRVVQLIEVLVLAFGGFYVRVSPPDEQGKHHVKFAVGAALFLTLIIFLIVAAIVQHIGKSNMKKTRSRWFIGFAVLFLILAIIGIALYYPAFDKSVVGYPPGAEAPTLYVKGQEYKPAAKYWKDELKDEATDILLLTNFGGEPTKVWTESSIYEVRWSLAVKYIVFIVTLSVAILCATEAWSVRGKGNEASA